MLEEIKSLIRNPVLEQEPLPMTAVETIEIPMLNLFEISQSAATSVGEDVQMHRPQCGNKPLSLRNTIKNNVGRLSIVIKRRARHCVSCSP